MSRKESILIALGVICFVGICIINTIGDALEELIRLPTIANENIQTDYSFYQTHDSKAFLDMLHEIDISSNKELLSISNNCEIKSFNTLITNYTLTYKLLKNPKAIKSHYNYFLYETDNEKDYLNFIKNSNMKYEVIDISISNIPNHISSFKHYIITYKKNI